MPRTTKRVLGLEFFQGSAADAVNKATETSPFVVAPSGTCFTRLREDESYRRAMLTAELVLPDSGLMVLLWRVMRREQTARISGLAYLRALIRNPVFRSANVLWVLPNEKAREKFRAWAVREGLTGTAEYIAPVYASAEIGSRMSELDDPILLDAMKSQRPGHVVIALSGGVQEKLGAWLRNTLDYKPAIHCIGGALGFLTGDQVAIPAWADRLYLGWLFRLLSNPRRFIPRARHAFSLPWLIRLYGTELPPMLSSKE